MPKKKYIPGKPNEAKVLFIGPAGCGKTSFLGVYMDKSFLSGYVPTVIDNFSYDFKYQDRDYDVVVWDTAGTTARILQASLDVKNVDLVCMCYSIGSRLDFGASLDMWRKYKVNFIPGTPIYLIGMKSDLRIVSKDNHITREEGEELARRLEAVGFMETSALTYTNIDETLRDFSKWIAQNIFSYSDEDEKGDEEGKKEEKKPFFKRLFGG